MLSYALSGFGVLPIPGIGPTAPATVNVQPPQPVMQVGPWILPMTEGAIAQYWVPTSAADHRTVGYLTADQTTALMQGIVDAAGAALIGAVHSGGMITPTAGWSKTPAVGVAVSGGTQSFPGPTRIPAAVLGEGGEAIPIYKFTHPVDGRRMGLYVRSVGTERAPAIQLVYRYDPGLLEQIWNGLKELVAAIVEVVGDLLCPISCNPKAVAAAIAAYPPAALAEMVLIGTCSCPVPQTTAPWPKSKTPSYTGWVIGGLLVLGVIGAVAYQRSRAA